MPDPEISIILPSYNEEKVIGGLIERINKLPLEQPYEVIVVDDCSTDDTVGAAEAAGARVVRHPVNSGNGASVKSGARAARGRTLVFLDGDGQHPPEDIPKLLEHIGEYDMAVGSRTKSSDTELVRNLGNWGLRQIARIVTGRKIPDLTSGFRAVKKARFLEFYKLYPQRYSYPTTITISMLRKGRFVKFVPLDTITRREKGTSNINPVRDGAHFIIIMLRIIMFFAPHRVFLPVGGLMMLGGAGLGLYQILTYGGVFGASITLSLGGIFIMLFGLLADLISTTMRNMAGYRPDEDE